MTEEYVGYKIGFQPGLKGILIDLNQSSEETDFGSSYSLAYYGDWKRSKDGSSRLVCSGTEMFDDYPSLLLGLRDSLEDESLEARLAFDKEAKKKIPEPEKDLAREIIKLYNLLVASKRLV